MPTTAHLNQESHIVKKKSDCNHYYSLPGSAFMLFSVLKMTTNSEESCPVEGSWNVFTLAVSNPDGFRGLRGHDCNATGD